MAVALEVAQDWLVGPPTPDYAVNSLVDAVRQQEPLANSRTLLGPPAFLLSGQLAGTARPRPCRSGCRGRQQ